MKEEEYITEEEADRQVEESRSLARSRLDDFKLSNDSEPIEDIVAGIEQGLKDGTIVDNWKPVIEWGAF